MPTIQFFGQHLISAEVVTQAQLDDAVNFQKAVNLPLGALALSKALLSERQVLQIHTQQRRTDQPFGEIAVQRGFLTRDQLDELLKEQAEARILLGEALVQKGHLSRDQLNEALIDYHTAQGDAETAVKAAYDALPNPDLGRVAAELATRMLLRLAGQVCKVRGVAAATPGVQPHTVHTVIAGDSPFALVLGLDDATLLKIARVMLKAVPEHPEPEQVDDLVRDTGKEFLSITCGHICSLLSRQGVKTMPAPVTEGLPKGDDGSWTTIEILLTQGVVTVGLKT